MKKSILITLIIIMFGINAFGQQDSSKLFEFHIKNWTMRVVDFDNFYPTYLADPLGIRFEVSSQSILFSDIDFADKINDNEGYLGKLTIYSGVRFSLFKFRSKKNPKLGFEFDLGVVIPTIMRAGNHDLIGVDGIYYFAVAGQPYEWLSLRFSKHHICTHIGDEFTSGNVNSPIDFDPNVTQLPVRDDFILSAAVRPLYFLKNPQLDILTVYGDFGFFLPGVDFMGTRQNKPNRTAYLNLQSGLELEYYFKRKYFGGLFTAYNVSAWQPNAFSLNQSFVAGYIFPQIKREHKLRIGFNYYNGRSLSNQFYNRKEKFVAFFVAADI